MAWFRKKQEEKCIHHWHYVRSLDAGFVLEGKNLSYCTPGSRCLLFCPKCEKESVVFKDRWTQLHEIQKIRESYQKATNTEEIITPANPVRKGRLYSYEAR